MTRFLIMSDSHLGVKRFREDSFEYFKQVVKLALDKKVDAILHSGDFFDKWNVPIRDIVETLEIVKPLFDRGIKLISVAGNHDYSRRDEFFTLKLLHKANIVELLDSNLFEFKGIKIGGISYVPNEVFGQLYSTFVSKQRPDVVLFHQDIKEITGVGMSIYDFSKYKEIFNICGHIHKHYFFEDYNLLLPGSIIATKINEDETERRSVFIWDSNSERVERLYLDTKPIKIMVLDVSGKSLEEIYKDINKILNDMDSIVVSGYLKIKLKGVLKKGLDKTDLFFDLPDNVFLDKKDVREYIFEQQALQYKEEGLSIEEYIDDKLIKSFKKELKVFNNNLYNMLKNGRLDEFLVNYIERGES